MTEERGWEEKHPLSDVALRVLNERYFLKDDQGEVCENWDELVQRVSDAVAEAEVNFVEGADAMSDAHKRWSEAFASIIGPRHFLPNSPTLMNAGVPGGQLSACFVLPVDDDIPSIFDAVKEMAVIFKSGGGVGLPMSRLRPTNDRVASTGGVSSGPVSFMQVYNTTAEVVAQGGKRRGALMGTLRVDHPDITEFIEIKRDRSQLTSFNVSVAITDDFMDAVKSDGSYNLVNPRDGRVVGSVPAKAVWKKIVSSAWENGEPGLIFIDRMNRTHKDLIPDADEIEGTNPCGEIPLVGYESCNLGSINVKEMVIDPHTEHAKLDETRLKGTAEIAARFLDNVIEINTYPLPEIEAATKKTRKIGLGIMGFADLCLAMGVKYDSAAGKGLLNKVLSIVFEGALNMTEKLAEKRGAYPAWVDQAEIPKRRNGTLTALAPTGSISMIADVSGGIEPVFAWVMQRGSVLDGTPFTQVNSTFVEMLKQMGWDQLAIDMAIEDIQKSGDCSEIPKEKMDLLVCAHEVYPRKHVDMQATAQKWSENAVSKTVNLPSHAVEENVASIFMQAWDKGCKGVTIYRDGCRENQPMSTVEQPDELLSDATPAGTVELHNLKLKPKSRPISMEGSTVKMKTGCGTLFVTVNRDAEGNVAELFAHHGKAGVCSQAQCEAIGRLSSMSLRAGVDPKEVAHQLRGITCHETAGMGPNKVHSCGDGIAKAILHAIGEDEIEEKESVRPMFMGSCPNCGAGTVREAGCVLCKSCGWDKCS